MYTPASFVENDREKLFAFMQRYSFATLVSGGDPEPSAGHFPLLIEPHFGSHGRLLGHMARANPLWKIADGQRVLAIFTGPHAYVSPSWYEADQVVPTWNYVSVHAYGRLRVDEDLGRVLERVRNTVDHYEAGLPAPWSMDTQDKDFMDRLLKAIVGFEIELDRIQGKWKLNQNHSAERRQKVIRALRLQADSDSQQIADLMDDLGR
jgi:transcriptional regulator